VNSGSSTVSLGAAAPVLARATCTTAGSSAPASSSPEILERTWF
jgi:hypothetical protein